MRIAAITRDGVIGVDAYTRHGVFVTRDQVDVVFEDGGFLRIPPGFVFDGASIPPAARSLIGSLTPAGSVAFVLHDYAYADGAVWITPSGSMISISRQRADWIALALCTWLELDVDDQLEIYAALRVGGSSSYRKLPVLLTVAEWIAR